MKVSIAEIKEKLFADYKSKDIDAFGKNYKTEPNYLLLYLFNRLCMYKQGVVRDLLYHIAFLYVHIDYKNIDRISNNFDRYVDEAIWAAYEADPDKFSLNKSIESGIRTYITTELFKNIEDIIINYICHYLPYKDIYEVDSEKFDILIREVDPFDVSKNLTDIIETVDNLF